MSRFQRSTHKLAVASLLFAGVLSAGCAPVASTDAPPDPTAADPDAVTFEFLTPSLTAIAPSAVALGDKVTVFGKDFVDDQHGTLALHYKGTYKMLDGSEKRVEADFPLTYVSPGQATFEFGPDIVFSPTGQDLGTFSGNFQVVSTLTTKAINAEPGDPAISDVQFMSMTVGPSIYIEQLRSVDSSCDSVTKATIGDTNLALGVKALGMGVATTADPITFSFTFQSPGLIAKYVRNESYSNWPLAPTVYADTQEGTANTFSMPITTGASAVVDPQHFEQVVTVSPPVTILQQQYNEVKIARLSTGPMDKPGSMIMSVIVQAKKTDGTTVSRTINFPVWNQIEVQPSARVDVLKEIYPAEGASLGCTSGGLLGADVQYSEGTSEQKSRTINMTWNISNSASLGLTVGTQVGGALGLPLVAQGSFQVHADVTANASWTQTYGVDVSQSVSSEEHNGSTISIHIPPNFYAMSYRQVNRLERTANVVYHNACGVSGQVGVATLTNWSFGYDVAQGPACPPPTKLPPAQKFD